MCERGTRASLVFQIACCLSLVEWSTGVVGRGSTKGHGLLKGKSKLYFEASPGDAQYVDTMSTVCPEHCSDHLKGYQKFRELGTFDVAQWTK